MTPDAFLAKLPADRRNEIARVRDVIRRRLPNGYEEAADDKFIVYQVPLSRYPDMYNKRPLMLAALASQKNYMALYLMPAYGSKAVEKKLRDGFKASGKKLDMGKSCIRFRSADDLDLDVIGEIIAMIPTERWIEIAESARSRR